MDDQRITISSRKGEVLVTGFPEHNLYRLNMKVEATGTAYVSARGTCSLNVWHWRLGHAGESTLKKMISKDMVTGMQVSATDDKLSFCEGCVLAKIKRRPFPSREERSCSASEIIHADVCGPMQVESLSGARYAVVFKDEATSVRRVYFLRSKSEALDKFKEFVSSAEADHSARGIVKRFMSDGGGEFCNAEFDKYLLDKGIVREKSAPHSPQSNGFAEAENRILMEKARSMLLSSGLPNCLWAHALAAAAYVSNRIAFSSRNETPFELWFKKKPDLAHMRSWGCESWYKVLTYQQKLDPRARKGFFVGYTGTQSIFLIWDPEKKKVIEARDVVFNEESASGRGTSFDEFLVISDDDSDDLNQSDEQENNDIPPAEQRKGPGRPPGSRNKQKEPATPHSMSTRSSTRAGGSAFLSARGMEPQSVD